MGARPVRGSAGRGAVVAGTLVLVALIVTGIVMVDGPGRDERARAAAVTMPTEDPGPSSLGSSAAPPASARPSGPAFVATVRSASESELGVSYRPGCPVGPADLRVLELSHWGFDGGAHQGVLVVRSTVADAVVGVFARLYAARFPIRSMRPVTAFGADDDASMAADNTSGFNCRLAVAPGAPAWSAHAFGEAIDVNPVENPYLESGRVLPPAGAAFLDRAGLAPGTAIEGGVLVEAFAAAGWSWGGRWSSPDYQHFSARGT